MRILRGAKRPLPNPRLKEMYILVSLSKKLSDLNWDTLSLKGNKVVLNLGI